MGKISINYNMLSSAASNLRSGASACRRYSDNLRSRSQNKLSGIEGGLSGYVWDAYTDVSRKQNALNEKADRMDTLSRAITELRDYTKDTDRAVAQDIESKADTFQSANGMECGWIESAWNWLCNGVSSILNATELGQAIADAFRTAGDWLADKWRRLRQWYDYYGGKFWVGIGTAILAIAVAIVTIITAGTGILAIIAVIGAVIAIANGVVKLVTNIMALSCYKEDPYRADKLHEINTLPNLIRLGAENCDIPIVADALNFIANTIDVVDTFCAIVGLVDSVTKIYQTFTGKETLFQKYLGQGGVVDSIFAKDISGPNSNLRRTRAFDRITNRWYQLDADSEGGRVLLDFKKAEKIKLDFKTGIKRMKSTVFPSFTDVDGSHVPRITGFDMLKTQFKDDLTSFPADTSKAFRNVMNNLHNMVNNAKGNFRYNQNVFNNYSHFNFSYKDQFEATHIRLPHSMVMDEITHDFTSWTGIDDVVKNFKEMIKGDIKLTDTIKTIDKITKIPGKIQQFIELDWFEFGDMGTVNKLIDKLSGKSWSNLYDDTLERFKNGLDNLGKPSAVPAQ